MDIDTTKIQLKSIAEKFDSGKDVPLDHYSPSLMGVILFYLENKSFLC